MQEGTEGWRAPDRRLSGLLAPSSSCSFLRSNLTALAAPRGVLPRGTLGMCSILTEKETDAINCPPVAPVAIRSPAKVTLRHP